MNTTKKLLFLFGLVYITSLESYSQYIPPCSECKCPCKPQQGIGCLTRDQSFIFFSYAKNDQRIIQQVEQGVIDKMNIRYWAYQRSCAEGDQPDSTNLKDLIKRSKILVFIATKRWGKSKWSRKEYKMYLKNQQRYKMFFEGTQRDSILVSTTDELESKIGEIYKNKASNSLRNFMIYYKPKNQ